MKQQDAIALLKADHKTVKDLFKQVDDTSERAKTQLKKLGDQICAELTVHAEIEEQIFYPAVKERVQRGHKEEKDLVLESYEEHAAAKKVIEDIRATDSGDESYKPKITTLSELIDHHVKEEEHELFPAVKELFDEEQLVELGRQMAELKTTLQERVPTA
ncbi:MAG TPA: hemerythrin domain-containing protein [Candidatus Elarobacter sp.]|jgi:hemerythrin superfamily protein|nr:hemerythrin domain-containing protein [Candidatus Elarobacter sp.]